MDQLVSFEDDFEDSTAQDSVAKESFAKEDENNAVMNSVIKGLYPRRGVLNPCG